MSNPTHPRAATVGQLKETGYKPCSVKDELRRNVIAKLKEELFPRYCCKRNADIADCR